MTMLGKRVAFIVGAVLGWEGTPAVALVPTMSVGERETLLAVALVPKVLFVITLPT